MRFPVGVGHDLEDELSGWMEAPKPLWAVTTGSDSALLCTDVDRQDEKVNTDEELGSAVFGRYETQRWEQ